GAVERRLPERCGPRERSIARDVDAVVEGRRAQYVVFPREVHGDAAGDQDVRAEREVGAVLFQCADGQDQPRVAGDVRSRVDPAQRLEAEGEAEWLHDMNPGVVSSQ